MIYYRCQFFKTKEEAIAFQKSNGCGAIYSNEKGSRTKKSYLGELAILGRCDDEEFIAEYKYVVAWNQKI